MFEKASRLKLRFDSGKGAQLSAEDLWDLPLTQVGNRVNLDDIARELHRKLKNGDDVSFVDTARKSDAVVQLKFDIVKHIIDVKLAERDARQQEQATAAKREQILQIIAERELDNLKNIPLEELRKMV